MHSVPIISSLFASHTSFILGRLIEIMRYSCGSRHDRSSQCQNVSPFLKDFKISAVVPSKRRLAVLGGQVHPEGRLVPVPDDTGKCIDGGLDPEAGMVEKSHSKFMEDPVVNGISETVTFSVFISPDMPGTISSIISCTFKDDRS